MTDVTQIVDEQISSGDAVDAVVQPDTFIKKVNPLDNSRPLDVHRWSEYPEVKQATKVLCEKLGLTTDKEKRHCRVILLDLFHCHLTDPDRYVAISLNSRSYEMDERYNKLFIKYDVLKNVVEKLHKSGYIEFNKGFNDRISKIGKQTRIRANTELLELIKPHKVTKEMVARCKDEEIILQRDKIKGKQRNIPYTDTPHTKRLRINLTAYNDLLAKTEITIDSEDHSVDLTRKKIYRIFNNGTWTQGGRFYGGFWIECKKELRPHILINGKPTKECDFSCMHMHLLYAHENINYADKNEDAYTIAGYEDRDLFKQMLLIALNAKARHKGLMALIDDDDNLTIKDLPRLSNALDAFITKHKQVSHLFFTGLGTRLQYFDSLIAEDIINSYTAKGIPVLSVHDSFIIQSELADDLESNMLISFYKVVKFYYNSKGVLVHGMHTLYDPAKEYVKLASSINIKVK